MPELIQNSLKEQSQTIVARNGKVKWGVLDDYEVTQKIGRGKYSRYLSKRSAILLTYSQ